MKVKDYRQLLKARGYKCKEQTKYQGINVFEKDHKFNKVVCKVIKDKHGKAQEIIFNIYPTLNIGSWEDFKEAEFDRGYLVKELWKIADAFTELRNLKAPKYIYF